MTRFEQEIREQPAVLGRLLERGRVEVEVVARTINAANPAVVFIAARGTSDNAARYAQYLFGARNGLPVGLATPSLATLYDSPPHYRGMLMIGISQSGQSPDIVAVLAAARRQGALTLAITNDLDSPLAAASELCLPLHAGAEQAVAASKTYTSQLLALAMLSSALAGEDGHWLELARLPALATETLQLNAGAAFATQALAPARRFVVIGRGYNYATAFELALKLKETCSVAAEPFSSADFLHGPIAMVERDVPVVLVAPSGRAFTDVAALVERLREREARIVAISDASGAFSGAVEALLPLPAGIPEWLSPIPAAIAGQLLALGQATARGLDPDQPSGLRKVTRTR